MTYLPKSTKLPKIKKAIKRLSRIKKNRGPLSPFWQETLDGLIELEEEHKRGTLECLSLKEFNEEMDEISGSTCCLA